MVQTFVAATFMPRMRYNGVASKFVCHIFFTGGGHPSMVAKAIRFWTFRDERIQYVTEMVERHEGEYRRRPRLALSVYHSGETEDWRKLQPLAIGSRGPDLHLDHPFITHRRLQLAPSSASGPGSTIVRRTAGQDQPLAASYEARNVFIANLPETFLCSLNTRTVDEVYQEWTSWEVIIGGLAS